MSAAVLVANCIFVKFYQIRSLLTRRVNVGYQPQNSVVDLRSVYNEFSKKLVTQLRGFTFLPNPTWYVNRWRTSLMKCTEYFTLYCYRCLLCDSLCSHGVLCAGGRGPTRARLGFGVEQAAARRAPDRTSRCDRTASTNISTQTLMSSGTLTCLAESGSHLYPESSLHNMD